MKLKIILIILLLTFLIGCATKENSSEKVVQEKLPREVTGPETLPEDVQTSTIKITSSGFEPSELKINKGDMVIFLNTEDTKSWPASAIHPTHEVYPGSSITKCKDNIRSIFDACKGLEQGESFSFVFNEKGAWKYHDHLNPRLWGTIIIE